DVRSESEIDHCFIRLKHTKSCELKVLDWLVTDHFALLLKLKDCTFSKTQEDNTKRKINFNKLDALITAPDLWNCVDQCFSTFLHPRPPLHSHIPSRPPWY